MHKTVIKALKRRATGLLALPPARAPDENLTFVTKVGKDYKVKGSFAAGLKRSAAVLVIKVMEFYF